jgi:hypothetical protein
MKERTRNSSLKQRRKHGFRAKPYSARKRKHKRKPGGGGTKSRMVRAGSR